MKMIQYYIFIKYFSITAKTNRYGQRWKMTRYKKNGTIQEDYGMKDGIMLWSAV